MLIKTLKSLFYRDLNRLKTEIISYSIEENIWIIDRNIANSAGNLCLHLIGNLQTYIGAEIGKTGYIRNREAEFALRDIPRAVLLDAIDDTIRVVDQALDKLKEDDLKAIYPILVFDEMTTTEYLLVHLTTHLTYHLGQINYHRRLLDKY
ncbi:DinB family protein [Sphingobacterium sp.]|uniref:DinB family protein n=1 Tax=Sphingobacterium sp. TaxID=341027 RepID=UPI0031D89399